MIIYITGIPAAGKTTLVESIEKELGEHSDCSPLPLFKGKLYKDTFVMHCDTLSYGTIGKFKDFVNFFECLLISVLFRWDLHNVGILCWNCR